ncbi:hypothetical protein [Sandaracinus amylolyticus]|uniref:Tetratricopeptide repeat protein n=1 Tax=Sandaracinus amylolyticus TaxID=927083 RepID=A0A0F6YHV0_9BACT|nr:hypothetical protein [Sandaracinus amylolyticus]AKF05151.1 hypothetical protein DB32_002300 [Sandaracinus amylolyticus]
MSGGMHDDDAMLRELIEVLRGAAPEGEALAALRAEVVAGASRRGRGGSGGAWVIAGIVALLVSGGEVAAAPAREVVRARDVEPTSAVAPEPAIVDEAPVVVPHEEPAGTPVAAPPRARRRARVEVAPEPALTDDAWLTALASVPASAKSSPAPSDAPSTLYADALRAYAAGRCDDATPILQRVIEGESEDAPAAIERAELLLAECLFRSGFVQSSFAMVDAIARRGEVHTQHDEALDLLGRIAQRAPDPDALVETVSHYSEDRLVRLEGTPSHDALLHLLARARYVAGDFDAAARLFARARVGTRWYVPSRYWEGVTHVRRRRAQPATRAFQAVIDAVGTDRDGGSGEREHLRDLARIAIARVAYTAATPGREGADPARQTVLLERALEAWQRVDFGSAYGPDAFFEESWALYLLGEHPRALGHVHGLLSPQLEDRVHPEALVLRATIYFEHCRYEAAERSVADFHARYDALLEGIAAQERGLDDADAAYALLDAVRSERGPSGVLGRVLRASFADRAIARQLVLVRSIDAEIARVDRASFASTSVAQHVAQELAIQRSLAVTRAGESVRARIARLADELRARANEIDTVQLEIETARRRALEENVPLTREPERPTSIVAVQGDQIWPFDGEYWDDELPYYREHVTSICTR